MLAPTAWFLATALSISNGSDAAWLRPIHVDCGSAHALDRALVRARFLPQVDIVLHGVCEGNFVIASDGVTLRAATPGSGLAAPAGNPAHLPVLEVVDVRTILTGLIVRGGTLGVYAHGWKADVFLGDVDVFDQSDAGVVAYRGARAALFESTVRDGATGVIADTSATINLQRVTVRNRSVGVVVFDRSSAALTDSTIEHCREAGMNVSIRSDVNIGGGGFHENAQVHANANDWSTITLLEPVEIGSEGDATPYSLTVARHATIASYVTPVIHGAVAAIDGGSIRLGSTALHGDVILYEFSNVIVSGSQVLGIVACIDGSDAICKQTTTAGAFDCPSPTCGPPPAAATARASSVREFPAIRPPSLDWRQGQRGAGPRER